MERRKPLALEAPEAHVRIRPVCREDAAALRANCWPRRSLLAIRQIIGRAHRAAHRKRGLGVVAVDGDDRPIGYGQLVLWAQCAEISDLVVAPPQQGNGIGTALIQYLTRTAHDMRAECVEIGVALSNPRALALYRRLGFADRRTLTINLGGGTEPVLFLRLDL